MKIEFKDISPKVSIQASFYPMDKDLGGRFSLYFWCNPNYWEFEWYTEGKGSYIGAKFVVEIISRKKVCLGTIIFTAENKKEIKTICSENFEHRNNDGISWLFHRQETIDLKKFVCKRKNVDLV
jgi:hypothetical protein